MNKRFPCFIFICSVLSFLVILNYSPSGLNAETKPSFVARLEFARGKPLTLDERISFGKRKIEMEEELDETRTRFTAELSRITGLSPQTIIANLREENNPDKISSELENITRKKLDAPVLSRIQNAGSARKEKILEIRKKYSVKFSEITGVKREVIMDYFPGYGL